MKKSIGLLIGFLVIIGAVPHVSLAAWYNPVSWFHHTSTVTTPPTASQSLTETTVEPAPTTRIAPTVVTHTITVHDPADAVTIADLQAQIATLQAQNTTLQAQITALQGQLAGMGTTPVNPRYTSQELYAQYTVNHPRDTSCPGLPNEDSRVRGDRCNKERTDYDAARTTWVNQRLAAQQ